MSCKDCSQCKSVIGNTPLGGSGGGGAHDMGGADHIADTLSNISSKITGHNLLQFRGSGNTAAMVGLSSKVSGDFFYNTSDPYECLFRWNGQVWLDATSKQWTNKSGGSLVEGDTVIIDTGNDFSVDTTNVLNNSRVVGAVLLGGNNNAQITVADCGRRYVYTPHSTSPGDWMSTYTDPGTASRVGGTGVGVFARAIENSTGAEKVLCDLGTIPGNY